MNINQQDYHLFIITLSIFIILSNVIYFVTRSTKGIIRLSSVERTLITLPEDVKDVLVGILLGDAHIVKRSLTSNSRLVYAQTAELHKEYFNHVYNIFKLFCVKNYKPKIRFNIDKRTNKEYSVISFTTMQLPCFNEFREIFYLFNVKRVPYNIYELLTPRGLAFWIMDDGSRQGKGLHISVYAFSDEDVNRLMFTLQNKFNLKCSIHYNRDKKPHIYIFKESMNTLRLLVSPYFVKEMFYKLSL
jgi:LAGLIDADG DNA endonuclease family